MGYKSLLTVTTDPKAAPIQVSAAALLAQAQDAHLDALALGVDRTQVGYSYVGIGAVVLQVAMDRAADEARANEAAVKKAVAEQGPALRFAVETAVTQMGALSGLVASRARYADLVILPQPYGQTNGPEEEAVVEAALFEGMAPVLLVPETGLASASPKRVVLAWDQSREALSAARRALPFLKRAELVTIVVVDPPAHGDERSDPGGLLCQMLVRHGVKAEVLVLAKSLPRISEMLSRACLDLGADLLVMGAYGHSRFREAILGGATRDMLEKASLPVFMAH